MSAADFPPKAMLELFKDLLEFVAHSKKYWMLPITAVLLILGLLIVFGEGSTLLPLLYAIF